MTSPQKGRIFISYRRADSQFAAGRIYDRLVAHFGEEAIFMDVEAIDGGVDFVKTLENAVQSACAAGALAATRLGAQPSIPRKADVQQFRKKHNL